MARYKPGRRTARRDDRSPSRVRLAVELLEDRTLFSASPYLPPSHLLYNPSGLLSDPAPGEPLDIALTYLNQHAADLGLTPADLRDAIVTDQYTDTDTGNTHIYLRQSFNNLEVAYADIGIHLNSQGAVYSVAGGFVPGLNSTVSPATANFTGAIAHNTPL